MIPVKQTKLHNPPTTNGNCMAACLASLLEINIDDVSCFEDMDETEWWTAMIRWLDGTGYGFMADRLSGQYNKEFSYAIGCGKSPRGDFGHCVIWNVDGFVFDPHPSGAGIDGEPTTFWYIGKLEEQYEWFNARYR